MLVEAIGIFAVASVGRPTRRLDVSDAVRGRTEDAKKGFGMHGASADFDVVRLVENAALLVPEVRELQDEVLKGGAECFWPRFKFYFRFHNRSRIVLPFCNLSSPFAKRRIVERWCNTAALLGPMHKESHLTQCRRAD